MELPLMIQLLFLIMYGITESGGILIEASSDRETTEHYYWRCGHFSEEWPDRMNFLKKACLDVYTAQHRQNLKGSPHLDVINEASNCNNAKNLGGRKIILDHKIYPIMTGYVLQCDCTSNPQGIPEAVSNTNRTFYLLKRREEYFELVQSEIFDFLYRPEYLLSKFWMRQSSV